MTHQRGGSGGSAGDRDGLVHWRSGTRLAQRTVCEIQIRQCGVECVIAASLDRGGSGGSLRRRRQAEAAAVAAKPYGIGYLGLE
jgi:hypothetical protein